MTLLNRTNFDILTQLHDLLGVISHEAYCCPLNLLHGSSIGQHVRHTIEFYQCLCEQAPLGFIDYDARARDLRLETDAVFAQSAIDALLQQIAQIRENQALKLQSSLGEEVAVIPTTVARELVYMAEHAIHHFAIIKIALREQFPQVSLPLHFGVAYSTIKYQSQTATT
jgi:hypothetical protein